MWEEIRQRAKIELLHILFMIKVTTYVPDASNESIGPDTFFNWTQLPDRVRIRWQIVLDIFNENGFI